MQLNPRLWKRTFILSLTAMPIMNSKRYVEQGAGRYVVGNVEPYDQKNEMFKRPFWDPQMREVGKKFYFTPVMPRDKAGYRLHDQSMVNASWRLEREYALGVRGGRMGFYDWGWDGKFGFPRVPPGLKISETDPQTLTRWVKTAATFFGASLVGVCELDRRWIYSSAYNLTPEGGQGAPVENRAAQDSGSASKDAESAASSSDRVSLTDTARQLQELEAQVASEPVVDSQRVAEVRDAIDNLVFVEGARDLFTDDLDDPQDHRA